VARQCLECTQNCHPLLVFLLPAGTAKRCRVEAGKMLWVGKAKTCLLCSFYGLIIMANVEAALRA